MQLVSPQIPLVSFMGNAKLPLGRTCTPNMLIEKIIKRQRAICPSG